VSIVLKPFDVYDKAADGSTNYLPHRQILGKELEGMTIGHPQEFGLELPTRQPELPPDIIGNVR